MSARKIILVLAVLLSIVPLLLPLGGGIEASPLAGLLGAVPADTVTDGKPRYSVRRTGTSETKDLRKKTADLKDPDNLKTEVVYDEKDNTYTIGTSLVGDDATGTSSAGKGSGGSTRSSGTRGGTSTSRGGGSSRGQSSSSSSSTQTGAAGASSGSILPGRSGFTLGIATSFLNAPVLMTPEEYQQWSLQNSMQQYWKQKNEEAFEAEGKNKFDFTDMHFDLGPAEKIFGPGGVQIKTQGSE